MNYEFTNNWFQENAQQIWSEMLPITKPKKVLEIGSYEGASICFLIDKLSEYYDSIEIHAIDTWEGGQEHKDMKQNMSLVEEKFHRNTSLAIEQSSKDIKLVTHKNFSIKALSELIANNYSNFFDFIYIDGSHMASDVLTDAILSFELLKVKGIIGFDDYLWTLPNSSSILTNPKVGIDAFTNIFALKTAIFKTLNHQVYIQKLD